MGEDPLVYYQSRPYCTVMSLLKSLYLLVGLLNGIRAQLQVDADLRNCPPSMMDKVWVGYVPKDSTQAGVYKKVGPIPFGTCVEECCENQNCNVAFMFNATCYQVECDSDSACTPTLRTEKKFLQNAKMVLVRTVNPNYQWEDLVEANTETQDDLVMAASDTLGNKACMRNIDCDAHEECISTSKLSGEGVCACIPGYSRNSDNVCVPMPGNVTLLSVLTNPQTKLPPLSEPVSPIIGVNKMFAEGGIEQSSQIPPKKIAVSVISKQIRLPDNEASLSAFTVPAELPGGLAYTYKWELLSKPEGNGGTMTDTNGSTLRLNHLTEGLYKFKVTVTGPGVFGETEANVTVLPQKRQNEPPMAIVMPSHQVVKLPNTGAVLDASSSRDDSSIVKYHWELQQGPLGYQPNLTDTQILQLHNLNRPGNYTFKLTVTDTEGATNSTITNVTVLQVPDYPPEANAGPSVVLYMPHNNVTLNGSLSSDDRGIVSWEWTKSPGDQDKAVDMQNTHTPYLQLSHLEVGMYTFVLKVTDDSGQTSSSDVHVFIRPATNKPPSANAGTDQTIALPQTWIVLNGTQSNDDISIVKWKWELIKGPNKPSLLNANTSTTNVTGLTKGDYTFQLTVTDGNDNTASDQVNVVVTQNKNARPKANAGGDQVVSLPLDVLVVNGSSSSDDLRIAKWQWTREPTSLALGTIIAHSETSPVLMVTNVVAGRYEFRLRVSDDQGEWSEDTVSINVKPDPEGLNLVELTLNIEAGKLSQSQRDSVLLKLGLLLHDASQLVVRDLKTDSSGRALLVFYVSTLTGSVPGPQVVRTLKEKLAQDSFLLNLSVLSIKTAICQNNCSGHGMCEPETRTCLCEAFWMEDLFSKYFGDGESNCDWSILYVTIALATIVFFFIGSIWGIVCLCSRLFSPRPAKEKMRYSLLDNTEQIRLPVGKVILSDSDTDSDVIFESRHSKTNGTKSVKNGFKADRRGIKT